ncbi:CYTH domain-containing protein [Bacillus sp. JCM 19034]|uniref:CYTH domain-containing protein n=1 Tax=Bacillus sp. JCM 19034 TaxID=1481928 RepID=UPI000782F227|nr:CYTH domain-containing protein [Bacillus sp. JCM 19034]
MNQEIEIEVKSMLTYENFNKLLHFFNVQNDRLVSQHNHYIETTSFSLKEKGAGLRVREKENNYTFTLKQPHYIGKLETHQKLTKNEWLQIKTRTTNTRWRCKKTAYYIRNSTFRASICRNLDN